VKPQGTLLLRRQDVAALLSLDECIAACRGVTMNFNEYKGKTLWIHCRKTCAMAAISSQHCAGPASEASNLAGSGAPCNGAGSAGAQQILTRRVRSCCISRSAARYSRAS
jgi:hypothetical protein